VSATGGRLHPVSGSLLLDDNVTRLEEQLVSHIHQVCCSTATSYVIIVQVALYISVSVFPVMFFQIPRIYPVLCLIAVPTCFFLLDICIGGSGETEDQRGASGG
jgi:hypothetical protein